MATKAERQIESSPYVTRAEDEFPETGPPKSR